MFLKSEDFTLCVFIIKDKQLYSHNSSLSSEPSTLYKPNMQTNCEQKEAELHIYLYIIFLSFICQISHKILMQSLQRPFKELKQANHHLFLCSPEDSQFQRNRRLFIPKRCPFSGRMPLLYRYISC